jgi:hypothetical protein
MQLWAEVFSVKVLEGMLFPVSIIREEKILPKWEKVEEDFYRVRLSSGSDMFYLQKKRVNSDIESNAIEVYGQLFSMNCEPLDINAGEIFYFSYGIKKFIVYRTNVFPEIYSDIVLIFDVTDKSNIIFYYIKRWTITNNLYIGTYPDKNGMLGIIVTEPYNSSGIKRARLYAIQDNQLNEVYDSYNKCIEIYYDWSKWDAENIDIVEKNVPQSIRTSDLRLKPIGRIIDREVSTNS